MIPKIIHLCWLSGDAFPAKIAKCIASWKKFLPDYEIMLWDTHRFPMSQSDWVREAFECKKYAFAADYIRFYALYHHGGIYLDSDVEILRSLDDFLSLPYFMGTEKAGTIEAAVMGSKPKAEWTKRCLDYYKDRHFLQEDGSMDIRTLPDIMVEVLNKWKPMRILSSEEKEHLTVNDYEKNLLILPDDYFSPKIFDTREVLITPNTYTIHHYNNSWFSPKGRLYYHTRAPFVRLLGYKTVHKLERIIFPNKFK
jgi:hypothetical protein